MANVATLDLLDRPLRDLRISVTDRCNLRCRYCMPREIYGPSFRFLPRAELLSFEEIARLARVFADLGVRKLRLTGGEPLLRRDLERLVGMLRKIDGIEEIAMTTNGVLLAGRAHALARAGLTRVTVSLDALEDEVLARIADAPLSVRAVLEGIEAAADAGLEPIKVNMVVRRGFNERCVVEMAERFRHTPIVLRFIEYMDVGSSNGWRVEEVVAAGEILGALAERWPLEALSPAVEGEVATRYRYLDGAGEIGVIHSVSKPFCGGCTRARLSAEGRLFTCLFARGGHDLRGLLRGGASEVEMEERVREVWGGRADRYSAERAQGVAGDGGLAPDGAPGRSVTEPRKIEMSYIGG
jgi:cyclic pyranopterin phosphate synthase